MTRKSKAQIAKEKAEQKKVHSLTLYVVFSIASLLAYTIVEQILSATTGFSNDTLTGCFFACFGGEILMCGLIKIFKLKNEKEVESNEMAG